MPLLVGVVILSPFSSCLQILQVSGCLQGQLLQSIVPPLGYLGGRFLDLLLWFIRIRVETTVARTSRAIVVSPTSASMSESFVLMDCSI